MNERIHRFIFDFSQPLRIEVKLEIKSDAKELKRLAAELPGLHEKTDALAESLENNQP